MKKVTTILLVMIFLVSLQTAKAQSKVGTSAAPFLNIEMGPRAIAMGGAYTGLANDGSAIFWNPGAMSRTEQNMAYFTYLKWFAEIDIQFASVTYQLPGLGTVGLGMTYVDYGQMEVTTIENPYGTGEYFSASDLALGASFARNLTDRFSIGGTVKYINNSIYNEDAEGIAIDVGTLYITNFNDMRLGISIYNFGNKMQMRGRDLFTHHDIDESVYGNNEEIIAELRTEKWNMPLTFRIGAAMPLIDNSIHKLWITGDGVYPSDNVKMANFGAEYTIFDLFSLRAGYKNMFQESGEQGLTFGSGVSFDVPSSISIDFDYAFQSFNHLTNVHHFATCVVF